MSAEDGDHCPASDSPAGTKNGSLMTVGSTFALEPLFLQVLASTSRRKLCALVDDDRVVKDWMKMKFLDF
jgi:hypothetical protein